MGSPYVSNAYEQTFQEAVIARSHETPVLVDFWAAWCNPCRILSPILEEMAAAGEGAWLLVKVNTDNNPHISRHYHIQGIPHCILFKDGAAVDNFVGVQSKAAIQRFLQKWLPPKENPQLTALSVLSEQGNVAAARQGLEALLAQRPTDAATRLALVRLELEVWDAAAALHHLAQIDPAPDTAREVAALTVRAHLMQNLPILPPDVEALAARLAAEPTSPEAHWHVGSAAALADDRQRAAEHFLWILERDRAWHNGAAKRGLLDLFALWGDDAPETTTYRQKMGWVLFA